MKLNIKKSVSRKVVKFSNAESPAAVAVAARDEPAPMSHHHNHHVVDHHESKSATKLFSIKSTINMKRLPVSNAAANVLNGNNKNKLLKNIVSVGVSFSNIFKPSKRMSKMDDQHIVIDPDVYLPPEYKQQQHPQKQQCSVRISIQSTTNHFKTPEQFEQKTRAEKVMAAKSSETPKLAMAKSTCDLVSVSKLVKQYSLEMQSSQQDLQQQTGIGSGTIRKTQPSMGVRAYSIKSRKAFFENMGDVEQEQQHAIQADNSPSPLRLTPFLDLSKKRPSISILSSTANNLTMSHPINSNPLFPAIVEFADQDLRIKSITPQKAFHFC